MVVQNTIGEGQCLTQIMRRIEKLRQDFRIQVLHYALLSQQDIVQRGQTDGSIRQDIEPMNVYINFIGLCHYHISSQHNYQVLFDYDASTPANSQSRRASICDAIVRYVRA